MDYATIEDIFNADLPGLFDGDECDDPIFTFDLFESELDCAYEKSHSLAFVRRSSITSVIPEDEVYGKGFPTKRRKSQRNTQECTMDQTLFSRPTNNKILAKETTTRMVSPPAGILSLFNPKELEQQLEHTKLRLAESIQRSIISRKRLRDQTPLDQEYCPSQTFNGQLSKYVHSSVLSSQSRAHFKRSSATPATIIS